MPECPDRLKNNIQETIGDIPYEIVWVDNTCNQRNICQAYNYGAKIAKYEYLCYMHDDIEFHTKEWGLLAVKEMNDSEVAMLGVQGCVYIDESTTYWCTSGFRKAHIIQTHKGHEERIFEEDYPCSNDVVAIDGCWMFCRRIIFESGITWDEQTFNDFHMYDMDLCMQILKRHNKIRILENLWIDHHSWGNYNLGFYSACKIFHNKWDDYLPVSTIPMTKEVMKLARKAAFVEIVKKGKAEALSFRRLSMWPYKIATKVSLLLRKEIWK